MRDQHIIQHTTFRITHQRITRATNRHVGHPPSQQMVQQLIGTIAVCAVVTLVLGLLPGPYIDLAKASLLPLP